MKRLIIILLLFLIFLPGYGQRGYRCNSVFTGEIVPKDSMVETVVRGKQLKPLNLDYFHSVKFEISREEIRKVADLVLEDAEGADTSENQREDGILTYAIACFEGKGNAFICYQTKEGREGCLDVVLIYMEGNTSLDSLKKKIKTQK